jgi:3-dehydroquinate dehydratase-1
MSVAAKIGGLAVGPESPRVVCNVSRLECGLKGQERGAHIVEIRCDLVDPPTREDLLRRVHEIRRHLHVPLIATIRKTVDGGNWYRFSGRDADRLPLFRETVGSVDALDIEHGSEIQAEVIRLCRKNEKTVILSHHNFGGTPEREEIEQRLSEMCAEDCDIVKMAYMVSGREDFLALFSVLTNYIAKGGRKPLTLIPMGFHGRPGRFMFPWFGSCLTYGCVTEEKAPSQPYVHDLVRFLAEGSRAAQLPLTDTPHGRLAFQKLARAA